MTAPAIVAFLRGIDRRAVVFARLQRGSDQACDEAVRMAVGRFEAEAPRVPVAEWPRRFWSLLLGAPALRGQGAPGQWPPGFEHLAALGHGPRAALLLRLVAGLPEPDAAAVLGIARGTYRLALQRALPHQADGSPDAALWQALGVAAQQAVRMAPPADVAGVVDATAGPDLAARDPQATSGTTLGRGRLAAMCAIALAMLLALAWTWMPGDGAEFGGTARIRIKPLDAAEAPASTYDAETALLTHPDFELLAVPSPAVQPDADPAFLSWLAARTEATRALGEAEALPLADALAPLDRTPGQPDDVTPPVETTDVP